MSEKRRIVFLNPIGDLGGAEQSLLEVLHELRRSEPGWELHLVLGGDGPLRHEAARLGAACHLCPLPPRLAQLGDSAWANWPRLRRLWALGRHGPGAAWDTFRFARRLDKLLRELQPDLIHSNGLKFDFLSALVETPAPLLWYVHDFVGSRPLAGILLRWASSRPQLVLVATQAVAEDARALLPGVPVEVVSYGIDLDRFAPGPGDGARLDELAGLPPASPDTLRFGLLATYARWKGQDLFVEAAARVCARLPKVPLRFYLIGGPIYQTDGSQFTPVELRALAAAHGMVDRVGFIPFQTDPVPIYRSLDVVVHASRQPEPFGRVIVEAMGCGRPVIAAEAGGARELFTSEVSALGVPPNDTEALAQAMQRLCEAPELRTELAAAARTAAAERFSRARMGGEMLAVYHRLLEAPARGHAGSTE